MEKDCGILPENAFSPLFSLSSLESSSRSHSCSRFRYTFTVRMLYTLPTAAAVERVTHACPILDKIALSRWSERGVCRNQSATLS